MLGILNKLFFWKRDEDVEDKEEEEMPLGEEPNTEVPPWSREREDRYGQERVQQPSPEIFESQQQRGDSSNLQEVIIAKLDVVNAKLDSLNQRMSNLERYAAEEEKKSAKW